MQAANSLFEVGGGLYLIITCVNILIQPFVATWGNRCITLETGRENWSETRFQILGHHLGVCDGQDKLEFVGQLPLSHGDLYEYPHVLVAQSCLTLYDPVSCSPPGSTVKGIVQARILERVAFPFSRASSRPRDGTRVSGIAGGFFTI